MTTITIKTRSKARFMLVKVRVIQGGGLISATCVGYAYERTPRVEARVHRLGAVLLPIIDGKVVVTA